MGNSKFSYEELITLRLLELNPLLPHYWSEFFILAKQLLNEEQEKKLLKMIQDVENFTLEKENCYNNFSCKDCKNKWKTMEDWFELEKCTKCKSSNIELLKDRQSLYDIEMAIESNADYTSYFERYGERITKFDIERKLSKVKEWVFIIIKQKSVKRRFRKFR